MTAVVPLSELMVEGINNLPVIVSPLLSTLLAIFDVLVVIFVVLLAILEVLVAIFVVLVAIFVVFVFHAIMRKLLYQGRASEFQAV